MATKNTTTTRGSIKASNASKPQKGAKDEEEEEEGDDDEENGRSVDTHPVAKFHRSLKALRRSINQRFKASNKLLDALRVSVDLGNTPEDVLVLTHQGKLMAKNLEAALTDFETFMATLMAAKVR